MELTEADRQRDLVAALAMLERYRDMKPVTPTEFRERADAWTILLFSDLPAAIRRALAAEAERELALQRADEAEAGHKALIAVMAGDLRALVEEVKQNPDDWPEHWAAMFLAQCLADSLKDTPNFVVLGVAGPEHGELVVTVRCAGGCSPEEMCVRLKDRVEALEAAEARTAKLLRVAERDYQERLRDVQRLLRDVWKFATGDDGGVMTEEDAANEGEALHALWKRVNALLPAGGKS